MDILHIYSMSCEFVCLSVPHQSDGVVSLLVCEMKIQTCEHSRSHVVICGIDATVQKIVDRTTKISLFSLYSALHKVHRNFATGIVTR